MMDATIDKHPLGTASDFLTSALYSWEPASTNYILPHDLLKLAKDVSLPCRLESLSDVVIALAHKETALLLNLVKAPGKHSDELICVALASLPDTPHVIERRAYYRYEKRKNVYVGSNFDAGIIDIPPATSKLTPAGHGRIRKQFGDGDAVNTTKISVTRDIKTIQAVKPWMVEHVVKTVPASEIDLFWPRLLPSILSLLDDTDVTIRARGCYLTECFVRKYRERIKSAGLDQIFWETIVPNVHFLPPLVSAEKAEVLHVPALRALTALSTDGLDPSRKHFVILEGCIKALLHTAQNVKLTVALLKSLEWACEELRDVVVAHSSKLIEVLVTVLSDPFIHDTPDLICAVLMTVISVCKHIWPRIQIYKFDLAFGLIRADIATKFFDYFGIPPPQNPSDPREVCDAIALMV